MTFFFAFAAAFIFWASIWWLAGQAERTYLAWKHKQYADKHFRQTERFRREFTR